jgi:CheY-like chemotaxis protein
LTALVFGMLKVLIVDDHYDSANVLARLLRSHGFEPQVASDPQLVLDIVRQFHPDAVLLDVMMPGMSGLDLLLQVKSNPQTAYVPVVMFSAVSKPEVMNQAMRHGASDYWIKASLDFSQIVARLNSILPGHEEHEEAVAN